jgi:hypothetical protein
MAIDFEITRDREFLKHFWNHWEIFKFSTELVDKLRVCDDPYGKYTDSGLITAVYVIYCTGCRILFSCCITASCHNGISSEAGEQF